MNTLTKAPRTTRPATLRLNPDLRARVVEILETPLAFMNSVEFSRRNAEKVIFDPAVPQPSMPDSSWYQPTTIELLRAADPSDTPRLMNTKEERLTFLRYNFAKKRLAQIQKEYRKTGLTRQLVSDALLWHSRYETTKEFLARTNLALVLAMAKRSRLNQVDFADVISEGNMALLRAMEKFSVDRGFKFSTYACRAILKAFGRAASKANRHHARFPVEFEPDLEKSDHSDRVRESDRGDCVEELKSIMDQRLADLSDVEETVIRNRFNWGKRHEHPLTLEEVGRVIGLTKERVRQIQNNALIKLREVLEASVLRNRPENHTVGFN